MAALILTEPLRVGDTIHILGHSTDFKQEVTSLLLDKGLPLRGTRPNPADPALLPSPSGEGPGVESLG